MVLDKVQELKDRGNAALKDGKYAEAIFHYTHALKLDPSQFQLYSNRSLAFLKIQQYYHAYEDAKETISLKPDWAKGYYRKAEVEYLTEHYADAIESYRHALRLNEGDASLVDAIRKSKKELIKLEKADQQIPWVGAGIGFILGVIVVVIDYVFYYSPLIKHPLLKLAVVGIFSILCFGLARLQRYYLRQQRVGLLQPPFDILGEIMNNTKSSEKALENPKNSNAASSEQHVHNSVSSKKNEINSNVRQRFRGNKM